MNNAILEYFRNAMATVPGTYFELDNGHGSMVGMLSEEFPDRTFITVNPEELRVESVMSKIVNRYNVMYYAISAEQYNQFLLPKVAETQNVGFVFFDQGLDYDSYADGLKIIEKYINIRPAQVVFADTESELMRGIVEEFRTILGFRIVEEKTITDSARVYIIREQ